MDVSVIVPTRNRCELLAKTVRSVLRQRDVELEIIIVDEASSDTTAAMLAAVGDARVRVIRHDRPWGLPAARNDGAAIAGGEWLAFLDDDDLWASDKLVRQLDAAERANRDWAYTGSVNFLGGRIVHSGLPLPPDETVALLPRYNAIPGGGSNVVWRAATWWQVGPFDTRFQGGEDWEMSIRLAKHGQPAWVNSPLMAKRMHETNMFSAVTEIVRATELVEALHHTHADWGRLHRWFGHIHLQNGRRCAAVGQFARAAARGQLSGVVSDLSDILQPGRAREQKMDSKEDSWRAAAKAWLRELGEFPSE